MQTPPPWLPSPIIRAYERTKAIQPNWYVEFGQCEGNDWIRGTHLIAPGDGPFHQLLSRIGARLATSDRKIVAASFALHFGWSAVAAIGPYLVAGCVPDVGLGNTSYKFTSGTLFERVAIHRPTGWALRQQDSASHEDLEFLDDHAQVCLRLRDTLLDQCQPVVEALRNWSRFSRRAIWGQVVSSWASQFVYILAHIGKPMSALEEAGAFFDDPRLAFQMRPTLYPVTLGLVTQVHHRRSTCCLYYKLPAAGYCSTCPLISHDERLRRNLEWMKKTSAAP